MAVNGDFEHLDKNTKPVGWSFSSKGQEQYTTTLDGSTKQSGKYSVAIENIKGGSVETFGFVLKDILLADSITISAYIKTQNVKSGYAGLWAKVEDGSGQSLFTENMSEHGITGTQDWKRCSITVPYHKEQITKLKLGGLLVGDGKAWFDNFHIKADGKDLDRVKVFKRLLLPAEADTSFSTSSRIVNISLNPQQIINLTMAGQFWSFLKYHHPAVAKGQYNWDAELFRLLPAVIGAKNNETLSLSLEAFLKKLPKVEKCASCKAIADKDYLIRPDYGSLFDTSILGESLVEKLAYIRDNRNIGLNYYVSLTPIKNPDFKNERVSYTMQYPDLGYRLLSLYRYWGIINYFFPSRNLIGEDWNAVLASSLPDFVDAGNGKEYTLAVLKLVSRIKDSHAALYGPNEALLDIKGRYILPVQATFIGNKLSIVAVHSDTLGIRSHLKPGDEIEKINGIPVDQLIKTKLPYTSSSNYDTQLRDLSKSLLRTNEDKVLLSVNRDGQIFEYDTPSGPSDLGYKDILFENSEAYKLINDSIGYVFPGKYRKSMLQQIANDFRNVRGVIVDLRCYPLEPLLYDFTNYVKDYSSAFVKITGGTIAYPGSFETIATYNSGFDGPLKDESLIPFGGKVVVIVNAVSQSQAEFTTMAIQSSVKAKVVGSTTAGADGDASEINLPGGLITVISGLGIFYPDGTPAQRAGVKIDYKVYPTLKGIKEGRDELLEKAIDVLNSKW